MAGARRTARVARLLAALSIVLILVVISPSAPARAAAPHPGWSAASVLAITQTRNTTMQQNFTAGIEVSDTSNIQLVYYRFCSLSNNVCYQNVLMTRQGTSTWYNGTTKVLSKYYGIKPGDVDGFNITIQFTNGTNFTEPQVPNTFPGLVVGASVTSELYYEMFVFNHTYSLGGTVTDSGTGRGISGANVALTPGANRTVTTSAGSYSFAGLFNGTYTLTVSAPGYPTSTSTVTLSGSDNVQNVPLSNGSSPPNQRHSNPSGGGSAFANLFRGTTGYAVIGAIVILVVGLLVWGARRSKGRGPAPEPSPEAGHESRPPPPG